ncbi:hypothetical protein NHX12_002727, partial [Muraenolepis orangiensis]
DPSTAQLRVSDPSVERVTPERCSGVPTVFRIIRRPQSTSSEEPGKALQASCSDGSITGLRWLSLSHRDRQEELRGPIPKFT